MSNLAGMADDIPLQALEPFRKVPQCANYPYVEQDANDGLLYCHEDSAKAQAITITRPVQVKQPAIQTPTPQPQLLEAQVQVLGIHGFWPKVEPQWSCWKHPERKQERRRLEGTANDPLRARSPPRTAPQRKVEAT
jgi:hypothetical protein